jgi:hypothetical protein
MKTSRRPTGEATGFFTFYATSKLLINYLIYESSFRLQLVFAVSSVGHFPDL